MQTGSSILRLLSFFSSFSKGIEYLIIIAMKRINKSEKAVEAAKSPFVGKITS